MPRLCIEKLQASAINGRLFPLNSKNDPAVLRKTEKFLVSFARTEAYRKSAIPFCQRKLNEHFQAR